MLLLEVIVGLRLPIHAPVQSSHKRVSVFISTYFTCGYLIFSSVQFMSTDEQVTLDDDPLWTCNFAHSKGSFSSPGAQLQPELGPGVPRRARGE